MGGGGGVGDSTRCARVCKKTSNHKRYHLAAVWEILWESVVCLPFIGGHNGGVSVQ